jgi:hypothetical protein
MAIWLMPGIAAVSSTNVPSGSYVRIVEVLKLTTDTRPSGLISMSVGCPKPPIVTRIAPLAGSTLCTRSPLF